MEACQVCCSGKSCCILNREYVGFLCNFIVLPSVLIAKEEKVFTSILKENIISLTNTNGILVWYVFQGQQMMRLLCILHCTVDLKLTSSPEMNFGQNLSYSIKRTHSSSNGGRGVDKLFPPTHGII